MILSSGDYYIIVQCKKVDDVLFHLAFTPMMKTISADIHILYGVSGKDWNTALNIYNYNRKLTTKLKKLIRNLKGES